MKKPTICVTGWYDHGNCGDESYKISFCNIFPHYEFIFSDQIIDNCDGYILGGGDVVTSHVLQNFQKISKPKHILSAAIPDSVDLNCLLNFQTIGTRDKESWIKLLNSKISAIYTPDFGFTLKGDPFKGKSIITNLFKNEKHDLYSKTIGIIINAHLIPTNDSNANKFIKFEHFCMDLSAMIDDTCASFVFIPFGYDMPWDDRATNSIIASRCKFWKKNIVIYDKLSIQQTLDIIASLDMIISTRLHSTIFSISNNIPFLDITHNHKNKNILQDNDLLNYSINYKSFSKDFGIKYVTNILKDSTNIKTKLYKTAFEQILTLEKIQKNVHLL